MTRKGGKISLDSCAIQNYDRRPYNNSKLNDQEKWNFIAHLTRLFKKCATQKS